MTEKHPDYKKIYEYICNEYKKTELFWQGTWDETFFSMRVYEFCKELAKKIKKKVNIHALLVASLLHDIGKIIIKDAEESDNFNHYDIGEKMAKDYLKSTGYSDEFIKEVCYLVKNHGNRKLENKSIELQILQDADYLADTGIAGCFRPFMGWVGKKMSIIEIIKWRLGVKIKNSRLNVDNLNLSISKKIMKKHLIIEKDFFKKVEPLINSDIIK